MVSPGAVAEWLGRGLQSLVQRFDSARRLSGMPRTSRLLALAAFAAATALFGGGELARGGAGPLHIHSLRGSVVRGGPVAYRVRIRANVCMSSYRAALRTFPDEFRITHFIVLGKRWIRLRAVMDKPAWLVPFGETWRGRPCGQVFVEDPIPLHHFDIRVLGSPNSCYGVALGINAAGRLATRRAIVRCGGAP